MLVVVSPAKNLDYESDTPAVKASQPRWLDRAERLVEICRKMSPQELGSLMKISDKLAGLNAARFEQWQRPFTGDNARPALFAFNGDVYAGLEASSLSADEIDYAQSHLRILSGLYGVLRPLDLMQPYRLEMGTKLENPAGKNLYDYWGDSIAKALNEDMQEADTQLLINLASNEYFSAVDTKVLKGDIITPVFKDEKNGKYKIISFYAKKARGMMARFILNEKPRSVSDLKQFDTAGYQFNEAASEGNTLVFHRKENA